MVLRKVWKEKKIKINIFKKATKELLYLCSRQLNFPFNGNVYVQCNEVAMCHSVRPIPASIFMTPLNIVAALRLCPYN